MSDDLRVRVNYRDFKYISDNSKECNSESAFLVTKSSKKYLEEAKERGSKIYLTPENLRDFLNLDIKIIGITGTNGKTTTSAIIYSLLLDLGYSVALLGTRGFYIDDEKLKEKSLTTPSLLELYSDIDLASKRGCDFFIMEVSSHAIEQERIEALNFELKILTNITQDHLDYHKTLENYIAIKNSFFQDESNKLINKDETKANFNFRNSYTYSIESASVFKILAYSLNNRVSAVVKAFDEMESFHSNLYGLFNLYNLIAGISAVKILTKKPLKDICEAVENFAGVAGRMEVISEKPLIIIDFAHTPDGMKKVLESFKDREVVTLFGAGGDRDRGKRALMGRVAESFSKRVILTSDNPRSEVPERIIEDILEPIKTSKKVTSIVDRAKAIEYAIETLSESEILLILGKGDESEQIIKDKRVPFSDRELTLSLLNKIGVNYS